MPHDTTAPRRLPDWPHIPRRQQPATAPDAPPAPRTTTQPPQRTTSLPPGRTTAMPPGVVRRDMLAAARPPQPDCCIQTGERQFKRGYVAGWRYCLWPALSTGFVVGAVLTMLITELSRRWSA